MCASSVSRGWLISCIAMFALSITSVTAGTIVDLTGQTNLRGAWLIEQPDAVEIDIRLMIEAGEYDNTGPEGLAHYLEHLVFLSADRVHGDFGDRTANAWTSRNWTLYWNNGPAASIEPMFKNAARVFSPVELDSSFAQSEVDIVEREFDLRITESPAFQLYTRMYQTMYAGHPFARSVIGSRASIRELTPATTIEFHRQWYRASNAYLLISGPLKARDIEPLIRKHFNDIPDGKVPAHQWNLQTRVPDSVDVEMTHLALKEPRVIYMRHAKALEGLSPRARFATCGMATELLNSAQPGGLTKPLYYDDFLTIAIESYCDIQPDRSNLLSVWAQPEDGVSPDTLFEKIEQALGSLAENEAFDKSFETIRKRLVKTLTRQSLDPPTETGFATISLLLHNNLLSSEDYIADLQSVQAQDVKRLLNAFSQSATTARGQVLPEVQQ